jgi:myo-inositol-1(or 4)-monophosphatase
VTPAAPVSAVLAQAADAACAAYEQAIRTLSPTDRQATIGLGADGTETYLLDEVVEGPVLDVLAAHGVNVLSEEIGWVDRGSAVTVVVDPIDGTANAAAGVPLSCFAAALVVDDQICEAIVVWLNTGQRWAVTAGALWWGPVTGRDRLDGASISMLRPRPENRDAWLRIADRAARVRVLGTSVLEAALVADGAVDAFCDPGGDVHRIVDIAATKLLVEAAGGYVVDALGRPFTFEPDLSLRWSGVFAASRSLADDLVEAIAASPPMSR